MSDVEHSATGELVRGYPATSGEEVPVQVGALEGGELQGIHERHVGHHHGHRGSGENQFNRANLFRRFMERSDRICKLCDQL